MARFVHAIKERYEHYERHISTITLVSGFIFDNLTLRRIDQLFDILALSFYVILSGICIIVMGILDQRRDRGKNHEDLHFWLLLAMQFSFGGLFSAFFIFYTRSATFAASWPFILVLLALLIGNEVFKARYAVLAFRVSVFFFILFSFAALYIPVFMHTIGDDIFIVSGLASVGLIWIFLHILRAMLPKTLYQIRKQLMWSLGSIYLIINILYFTNIIPPIPLAMKSSGVFHSLDRSGSDYIVREENNSWYGFLVPEVFHGIPGETAYVATSIFAPSGLKTSIVHKWQYYDTQENAWITISTIPFPIVGGRDSGYRGYSLKSNIAEGKWRVNIETERGQLIGRVKFLVKRVSNPPPLVSKQFM